MLHLFLTECFSIKTKNINFFLKKKFPFYKQLGSTDCGPTCLRIISKYYGKLISLEEIRELVGTTRVGSTLYKLSEAAEEIGFKSLCVKINYNQLKEATVPCIIHWNKITMLLFIKLKMM